jgi:hypothetical protein
MKRSHTPILVIGMLLIAGLAWSYTRTTLDAPGGEEVWRYDIIQVRSSAADKDEFPILFRVDTATGKTWRYLPPVNVQRNDVVEGWLQVPEITDDRLLREDERFLP